MDPHSESRKEYRERSALNLKRNQAFAAPAKTISTGHMAGKVIGLILILAVCFGLSWAAHLYFSLHSAVDSAGGNNASSVRIASRQPISVLVLGVDQGIEGRHDRGNSDTMILATLNPAKNKATMTSIPRDTLADIKGDPGNRYFMFKVNSAYEVGGHQASMKTVSALLNVPINYYLEVNMKALDKLVNAVGGVTVKVPFDFSYDWCDFHKGYQHLGGRHAVAYVRMRHDDPRGDYGRQMRQRQVIMAVAKKAMSVNTLANYRKLIDIFDKYVKTNLSFNDMMALALNYRHTSENLKSGYIQGHDAWVNNYSMQIASTKELQQKSNLVRANLGLNKEELDNAETRQNHLNQINNHVDWGDPNPFTNYQIYHGNTANAPASSSGSSSPNSQSSSSSNLFNIFK